jgi:hypothetical protein
LRPIGDCRRASLSQECAICGPIPNGFADPALAAAQAGANIGRDADAAYDQMAAFIATIAC